MTDQNLFKEIYGDNKEAYFYNIKSNLAIAIIKNVRLEASSQKVSIDDIFTKLGISDELSENIKVGNLSALNIDVLFDILYILGYRASVELSQSSLEDKFKVVIEFKATDK